ncbi:uncharacterized protein LOC107857230 [Capsicum annuum]|uniref:uncharacterized protein LOC107857230 n=1 Tax=Capsicum annuum TaxID=4072 RepID=UPI001FB054D4|nr:uncharacterized protein LOC107857230 [Capsicum annuum]
MDPYIRKGWAVISQHLVDLLYFCLRFTNLNGKVSFPFLVASCILSSSISGFYFSNYSVIFCHALYYFLIKASFSMKLESLKPPLIKDLQYDSVDSLHHLKHFVARREAPWKIDGESTGVSSKLKVT